MSLARLRPLRMSLEAGVKTSIMRVLQGMFSGLSLVRTPIARCAWEEGGGSLQVELARCCRVARDSYQLLQAAVMRASLCLREDKRLFCRIATNWAVAVNAGYRGFRDRPQQATTRNACPILERFVLYVLTSTSFSTTFTASKGARSMGGAVDVLSRRIREPWREVGCVHRLHKYS
jgi:hypothetical protein